MFNKSFSFLFCLLLSSIISFSQISVFSNTTIESCNTWNTSNNWGSALTRIIKTSGLPSSGLSASGSVLREVRVRLGNSACKGNLSSYQMRITNPQGVQVLLTNQLTTSTSASVWVDIKFRDDIALEKLKEYSTTVQSSYVPHSIGYYAIENDGDFNNFLTAADPNGDWIFQLIENTTSEVSFEKVELVFGPSINGRDVTSCFTNNFCSGASCIYNGVFRGNNAPPNYTGNDPQYPGNTVSGCSWNGNNNNSAWFSFKPTSTSAKMTISGMLNTTAPGSSDMQPIIVKANGNCLTPNVVPKGGCPKDQTINNRSYSSDATINPAPNTGGIGTSNIYSNGISDNCEFILSDLVIGDTYYLYVDGNGGQSSFFYIEVENGVSTPCDFCCTPITISGPTSICSGAAPVKYTQSGGTSAGVWSVIPSSAGTIDASGNFTPASGLTADVAAEIKFVDADCSRSYDIIVTKCTTFGSFASATWLTTCNSNSFYNTTGEGVDLIDDVEKKEFNGRFLGTFVQNSNNLKLRGAEVKTFKNVSLANVCGAKLYYRVTKQGAIPGSFASLNLPFFNDCDVPNSKFPSGGPCKAGDQKWQKVLSDAESPIDLTTYAPGNYELQVYYDVSGDANSINTCDPNDLLVVDNAGRYFTANFTIQSSPVYTPTNPTTCNGIDGYITISGLAPSTIYAVSYTDDAVVVGPTDLTSDANGIIVINGLNSGSYSSFLLTVNGCVLTNSSPITLVDPAKPTVLVNSPVICEGTSANISATPGTADSYSYEWTVPTGVTNPGSIATFTTTTPGSYAVIITNTTTQCVSSSASGTVTINTKPTVTVNSPVVCEGNIPTVTATPGVSGTYSYAWTPPTGVSNPGDVASFSATAAGSYNVIITNTTTNCVSDGASGTVTINAKPTVTVNSPAICEGTPATITATPGTAGIYDYAWEVPAGVDDPGSNSTFTTTVPGLYSVVITNTETNCISASASGTVSVNDKPTVTVNSPFVCEGSQASVTATPGIAGTYSYEWTVPTGVTNPGSIATFTTTTPGSYAVIITNTTTQCVSSSASGTVTINTKPTVTVNSPVVCEGNIPTVTATPGVSGTYSYAWTPPTGVSNPGDVASFSATAAGSYNVIITNTTTNCVSDGASGTVTINAKPTVTVNSPAICEGTPATITATPGTAGIYDYAWEVPAGVSNPGNVSGFSSAVAGAYGVTITNVSTTCQSAAASGTLTVTQKTVPTFTQLGPFCKDAVLSLTLPSKSNNNINGTWLPALINTGSAGTFSYLFKPDAGECAVDATMDITIKNLSFSVDAGEPITINSGTSAQATATLSGISINDVASILWTPSTGLNSENVLDPIITPSIPNGIVTYTITVKDEAGCAAKDDLIVNVVGECLDIKKAFTPNGDGINDKWVVFKDFFCLKNISVNVYNRYGSLVYQNTNYRNQWDGTYKGKPCPDGTYYAVLEIKLASGKKYVVKIDVTILR